MSPRQIPALPTLSPEMLASLLLRPPTSEAGAFPLDSPQAQLFYLGRNGVFAALKALGSPRFVAMPAYHHGVEVETVLHSGAEVRYYAVGRDLRPDLDQIRGLLQGKRGALLYLTHFIGFAQPMDALLEIAREAEALVLEDCALAFLSRDEKGRPLGARGDAAAFCFYKSVPAPDGGASVTAQQAEGPRRSPPPLSVAAGVARGLLAHLGLHGEQRVRDALRSGLRSATAAIARPARLERAETGTQHLNPSELDLGLSAMSERILRRLSYPAILEARRANYQALMGCLGDSEVALVPELPAHACPLFFPLLVDNKEAALAFLRERGIEGINFWSYGHPSCPEPAFPEVAWMRRHVLEIPIHQDLDAEALSQVARACTDLLGRMSLKGKGPRHRSAQPRPNPASPLLQEREGPLAVELWTPSSFGELEPALEQLLSEEPPDTFFRSASWLSPWWAHFGAGDPLKVLCARQRGRLVALLPFHEQRQGLAAGLTLRRWRLVGSGAGAADYLGIAAAPAETVLAAPLFAEWLSASNDFDRLDLDGLLEGDPLLSALRGAAVARPGMRIIEAARNPCPRGLLEGSFESYLRSRPNGLAVLYRRRLRYLQAQPGFELRSPGGETEAVEHLRQLVDLHRKRWGQASSSFEGELLPFHESLVRRLWASGRLRLRTLWVNGAPIAGVYGFRFGGTYHYYQSGYDPEWAQRSAGTVLIGLCMEECFRESVREWDFLRGAESYKASWVEGTRETVSLRCFAPTAAGRLDASLWMAEKAARRLGNQLPPRLAGWLKANLRSAPSRL